MLILKGAELRRNFALNPSLEVDTTDWLGNSATITRVTTEAHHGVASLSVLTNGASGSGCYKDAKAIGGSGWAAGDPCSASVWVKAPAGTVMASSLVCLGGSTNAPQINWTASGAWEKITMIDGVVPSGATSVPYVFVRVNATHAALTFYADELLIEKSSTPGAFFTGSTATTETLVYEWAGAENASASVEYERIPNLVAEPLADGPWAGVTVQGLEAGTHELTVWRSTADGGRVPIRGGRAFEAIDSAYLIDYEVPLGRAVSYEIEVLAGPDTGTVVSPAVVTVASLCGYVHDPADPSVVVPVWASRAPSGQPVLAGTAWAELVRSADVEVHNVMGSSLPVAIGGQRRAPSGFDLSMLTDAETQNTLLRNMVKNAAVLVVRGLPGWLEDAWPAVAYVALPEVVEAPLKSGRAGVSGAGSYLTRWTMQGQVVRQTTARVLIALFTYQDVEDFFETYDQKQIAAGGGTYLDDQKQPLG